jgi:hypothetical protein
MMGISQRLPIPDLGALPALLTVAETADLLRVGRSWVYEHASELGAVKLGSGQTAPLRIPRDGVQQVVGVLPTQGSRRGGPARRLGKRTPSLGELRPRPRL